jgi:uncharacterized protein YjbJ (UPF0337 family)
MMVNEQQLSGQWKQVRGALKKKWGALTDEDLRFANGSIDQLVGRIQHRTGEAREAIENFLSEAMSQGASMVAQAKERVGEYVESASNQMSQGFNRISDQLGRGYEASEELIRDNPGTSIATAFGIGVLLGVVVGIALRSR